MQYKEPREFECSFGKFVVTSDEDALAQYKAAANRQMEEIRDWAQGVRIMDSAGKVHPMPPLPDWSL